jgi:hypothetical protein
MSENEYFFKRYSFENPAMQYWTNSLSGDLKETNSPVSGSETDRPRKK